MLKVLLLLFQVSQSYLIMQPLQEAIQNGRFDAWLPICRQRVVVNLEEPLALQGTLSKEQFIEEFSARFATLEAEKIEWSSIQVEENIAVQSLNLILKKRFSGARVYYKLIFFMNADSIHEPKEKEWKLHYLRGIRI